MSGNKALVWLCAIGVAAYFGYRALHIYEKAHAPTCVCPEAAK